MTDTNGWLALALHEADLGERCKARGADRETHINAYRKEAERIITRLHSRWQPKFPPSDVILRVLS